MVYVSSFLCTQGVTLAVRTNMSCTARAPRMNHMKKWTTFKVFVFMILYFMKIYYEVLYKSIKKSL